MPTNNKRFQARFKKRIVQNDEQNAKIQKIAAESFLKNLARLTPVRTGRLAGGYVLLSKKGQRAPRRPLNNTTRQISGANRRAIDNIDGKGSITLVNAVPYHGFVNDGTRTQRPQRFVQRARIATINDLLRRGIRSKVV